MTEEQLINLQCGDTIHIRRPGKSCDIWTIDYRIDKYKVHAVQFAYPIDNYKVDIAHISDLKHSNHYYATVIRLNNPNIELVHLPIECLSDRGVSS